MTSWKGQKEFIKLIQDGVPILDTVTKKCKAKQTGIVTSPAPPKLKWLATNSLNMLSLVFMNSYTSLKALDSYMYGQP